VVFLLSCVDHPPAADLSAFTAPICHFETMGCGTSSSNVNAVDRPANSVASINDRGAAVLITTPRNGNANLPINVPATCTFGSKITKVCSKYRL
jgi:hypothetical protein